MYLIALLFVQQFFNLLQNGHSLSIALGSSLPVLSFGMQNLPCVNNCHFKVSSSPPIFQWDQLDFVSHGGLRREEISQPIVVLPVACGERIVSVRAISRGRTCAPLTLFTAPYLIRHRTVLEFAVYWPCWEVQCNPCSEKRKSTFVAFPCVDCCDCSQTVTFIVEVVEYLGKREDDDEKVLIESDLILSISCLAVTVQWVE